LLTLRLPARWGKLRGTAGHYDLSKHGQDGLVPLVTTAMFQLDDALPVREIDFLQDRRFGVDGIAMKNG